MVAKGKRGFSAGHDRLAGLFEPDVLLPAQFFAAFRREGGLERERLLMLAVLEDAVDCYQKYAHSRDPRGRQMYDEAREWVTSTDRIWLFAFENICDTLEINAEYMRRGRPRLPAALFGPRAYGTSFVGTRRSSGRWAFVASSSAA